MKRTERKMGKCLICEKQHLLTRFDTCEECERLIEVLGKEQLLCDGNAVQVSDRLLRILAGIASRRPQL